MRDVLIAIRDVLLIGLAIAAAVGLMMGLAMIPPAPWVLIGVCVLFILACLVMIRLDTIKRKRKGW